MILSLDANIAIDILRGRSDVRKRMDQAVLGGATLKMCSVVLHELAFGVMSRRQSRRQLTELQALLVRVDLTEWSAKDAWAAAELRVDLARQGLEIGSFDSLIAGQALARGWSVTTDNRRHFDRVPKLAVVDWSA